MVTLFNRCVVIVNIQYEHSPCPWLNPHSRCTPPGMDGHLSTTVINQTIHRLTQNMGVCVAVTSAYRISLPKSPPRSRSSLTLCKTASRWASYLDVRPKTPNISYIPHCLISWHVSFVSTCLFCSACIDVISARCLRSVFQIDAENLTWLNLSFLFHFIRKCWDRRLITSCVESFSDKIIINCIVKVHSDATFHKLKIWGLLLRLQPTNISKDFVIIRR